MVRTKSIRQRPTKAKIKVISGGQSCVNWRIATHFGRLLSIERGLHLGFVCRGRRWLLLQDHRSAELLRFPVVSTT